MANYNSQIQKQRIILLLAGNRDLFTRDDLHEIAKYADDIIVERFIVGDE